ncbi:MAG: exostosin family protein [Blastochloris sp.]|nr:exostosin family protein [Blastochloris sp.]
MRDVLSDHPSGRLEWVDSLWHRMDDPASGLDKQTYADQLRLCRFILCPRGNGVSSVRLFEALEAGRVPVILSDRFVPPSDPDWTSCVIQVPESQLAQLPDLLREAEPDWITMAGNARRYWEQHYADTNLLTRLVQHLRELQQLQRRPGRPTWTHHLRYARFSAVQSLKTLRRRLSSFSKQK